MVELKGSLGSIGLPAIVQLIGELRHSGNLELRKSATHGLLGFDHGRLVAASFDNQHGLNALAVCTLELADADFLFVEGVPADERTIDLGGSELQKHLGRLMSGELKAETLALPPAPADERLALGICPLLGFVDDAARHYSRATALHRCFSGGTPSLVTSHEQRELCLSGRYPTCPRYRNASHSQSAAPPPVTLSPCQAVAPPVKAVRPPIVPAGIAARMAAASQMRIATAAAAEGLPAWIGQDDKQPPEPEAVDADLARGGRRPRRVILLVAIGAVLGLGVLVGGLLVVRPALNAGLAPTPTSALAQPVGSLPTTATTNLTRPTVVPTPVPTSTPLPLRSVRSAPAPAVPIQFSAPTRAQPAASAIPASGQSLIDVRFASGASQGWLDNPPYAAWGDGAYRLQARQAARFVAVSVPLDQQLTDVVVSATFRKTGGPPGGGYGLIIRDQSADPLDGVNQDVSAFVMETGDLGEFGVWRRDGDHWVDLVPWTRSDTVRPGGSPNDLMARAIGDRLTFIVNATEVASVQDDTLKTGGVGVFVGGDNNEVALDRFAVQVPD
jgi:Domain of unknown function (DUF4388)